MSKQSEVIAPHINIHMKRPVGYYMEQYFGTKGLTSVSKQIADICADLSQGNPIIAMQLSRAFAEIIAKGVAIGVYAHHATSNEFDIKVSYEDIEDIDHNDCDDCPFRDDCPSVK